MKTYTLLMSAGLVLLGGLAVFAQKAGEEIRYPGEAFAKLDTFEGLNLEDADKLFLKKDYMGAFAAYKAYSFEFPKSKALPYVLLRMGRCVHLLGKRNAAVKAYQDVVDYFPDDVRYAAGALYYIGECHGQNGDEDKKTAVWARMVKDDEYVTQPNSGTALTYLGKAMEALGKYEEATEYHWRTATAFLASNPRAAQDARGAVLAHYVWRAPNHEKLKAFYAEAGGFDGRGHKVDKPEEDVRYWSTVLDTALRASEDKGGICAYWTAKMGDRFVEDDGLRKRWIDAQFATDNDRTAWMARMEKQFATKPATMDRVVLWCGYIQDSKARSAFFAKQGQGLIGGMKRSEKMALMNTLHHKLRMGVEAQAVLRAVNTQDMTDAEIRAYGDFAALYEPEETVMRTYARIKDKDFATKARFDYYQARSHRNAPNMEKALAEIPALQKSPKYAGADLLMTKGRLLQQLGRHEEAIKAFQAANKQPDSTWAVADCQVSLKQYAQAIRTVQGLESVKAHASRAAFRVADIYRISGDKGREVQQLRTVLRRYPKSGESSQAHDRLESYGVKVTGGESEAEE